MRGIGVPGLPAVPYLGSFAEVNVRTYVRRNGIPGVWFCSLDINRLLPTIVARTTYTLPYCFGRASNKRVGDELRSVVKRQWPRGEAHTNIHLKISETICEPSPLEVFLSARWGYIRRLEVETCVTHRFLIRDGHCNAPRLFRWMIR
ncbi:uncharacterized protein YqjF [Acidimicrobiaceae bacterium]|nr:uncharacterized protein YqjF [Acidimicrobiaceae bacterium]